MKLCLSYSLYRLSIIQQHKLTAFSMIRWVSAKLHYTQRDRSREVLAATNLPHRNAIVLTSTCQYVVMWQFFGRWWWICCTTSCRIVVSSSVGGVVHHVRSRCPCSGVWHLSRDYKYYCDSIPRRIRLPDYDGSDRNYDSTAIRLRSDYDVTRAPASIRRDSTRAKI